MDPGFTCISGSNRNCNSQTEVTGSVNPSVPGRQYIRYFYSGAAALWDGSEYASAMREVTVVDTRATGTGQLILK